jgi:hypothetical protein
VLWFRVEITTGFAIFYLVLSPQGLEVRILRTVDDAFAFFVGSMCREQVLIELFEFVVCNRPAPSFHILYFAVADAQGKREVDNLCDSPFRS